MAQDIVGSLFGMQQQPDYADQDYRNAVALANAQNPKAMGRFLGGMLGAPIGRALGQGVGSLFGVENPQQRQQRLIEQAKMQGFDTTTSDGLKQLGQFFIQNNAPELAARTAQLRNQMLESEATVAQKMREKQPKISEVVDAANWNRALQQANGNQDLAAQIYQKEQDDRAIAKARESRPVTNVTMAPYEKQYDIKRADLDVDTIKEYRTAARAASQELPNIAKIDELAKGGKLYTGPISDFKIKGAEFLVSAGLATKDQATKIANSREFESAASAGVLARIKKLGINPTDADREFATRMGPMLASNPQAIIQVNDYMRKRANETIGEAKRIQAYADKNKGLTGYDFNPNITLGGTEVVPTPKSTGGSWKVIGVK